jgi:ATP-dependent helicase HrpB
MADELGRTRGFVDLVARDLEAAAARLRLEGARAEDDASLRHALFLGYADRVAWRRAAGSPRLLLASGTGALLGRESGVVSGDFLVAHELGATPASGGEAIVRTATRIEAEWLVPDGRAVVHRLEGGEVRAVEQLRYGQILLVERPAPVEPEAAAQLLRGELLARGLGPEAETLARRLRVAGLEVDLDERITASLPGRRRLPEVDAAALLAPDERRRLDRLAPLRLPVPSGRSYPLEYREDGSVALSVKLQELFGLADSPRVGARQEPILLLLLAPNGRPVQTTRDLRSFWSRTYPEVRKELRGRYPRHPWPDDPWTAEPTHRTTRKPR